MAEHDRDFDDVTAAQPDPFRGGARSRRNAEARWTDRDGAHAVALDGRAVVGSAAGSDVVVADSTASRLHAELEVRDDGVWVRDLGSRNGTYLEGFLVGSARVPDGARLRVGATELLVRYAREATALDLWPDERFGPLVGRDDASRELFARLARIAASDATVLIQGETGTGKELVARAIHEAGARAAQPYVVVDCAALPENLLEAELFGHTRGAFTGATDARAGAIESASGGTVFLDEIGELPLPMQPKLLRAIESRAVRRIGETAYRAVDVRFVSATHRDLRTMVNAGAFREDLYFRLAVLPVAVPPLRARPGDIPLLVRHFLGSAPSEFASPDTLRELASRPWLGNVRELRNVVERARALGTREALASEHTGSIPPPAPGAAPAFASALLPPAMLELPYKAAREQWVDVLEREYLRGLLERHKHNITAVANAAGIDRSYVHRLIRRHDL